MDRAELERVLVRVLDRIDPVVGRERYRLVGTAAALLQGVPGPAGDLDVLMARREDVDRAAVALSPFVCRDAPAWLAEAGRYVTRFTVEGALVEISTVEGGEAADTSEWGGPGPWRHYVLVPLGGHLVPAVRLELRLVSELVRDRRDRVAPLIDHLRTRRPDLALLRRAMDQRGVAPEQRRRVLAELGDG